MKKVLILTITAGNGHNSCSNSMKEMLERAGVEVKIVDILKEFSNKSCVWITDKGYSHLVHRAPSLYNYFWEKFCKRRPETWNKSGAQDVCCTALEGLIHEIDSYRPDVILCVHYYATMAISDLRLVYEIPCKVIGANLDYVNAPYWEAAIGVDIMTLPCEELRDEFLYEGFQNEQLLLTGIPVAEKFNNVLDQGQMREKYGLDPDWFTVMILFGGGQWSGGYNIFKSIVEGTDRKLQIIMVNGKDEKGRRKVDELTSRLDPERIKVKNFGFVNCVDELMSATDVIVSKFGGMGATEIINKGVPFLITERLPCQELHNLAYFYEKGIASSFRTGKQLVDHISYWMDHPEQLVQRRSDVYALRTYASQDIVQLILEQPDACYNETYQKQIDFSRVKKNVKRALKRVNRKHSRLFSKFRLREE